MIPVFSSVLALSIAVSLFENKWLTWKIVSDDKIQISLLILRQGALSMNPLFPVQKAIGMRPVNKNYKVYLRGRARKINYLPSSKQCLFEVVLMEHQNGRSHTPTLFSWACHHRQWHLWWRSYRAGGGNEFVPHSWNRKCAFSMKKIGLVYTLFCTGWLS